MLYKGKNIFEAEDLYNAAKELWESGKKDETIPFLKEAEKLGHPKAFRSIGLFYAEGDHAEFKQNQLKAEEYLLRAVELGLFSAYLDLYVLFRNEKYGKKDTKKSLEYLIKGAEIGDIDCQFTLGYLYDAGDLVKQNYKKAIYWYEKAANQGNISSQINLSLIYSNVLEYRNLSRTVYWLEKAASSGDVTAQENLGVTYCDDLKDYTKAKYWYEKAAENGSAYAYYLLGGMYEYGEGVTKNISEANKCYQEALKCDKYDQYDYVAGIIYLDGKGVSKDEKKGFEFLVKASKDDKSRTISKLAECYFYGKGTKQDYKKAEELFLLITNKLTYGSAYYYLGIIYYEGKTGPKDCYKGFYYLKIAESRDSKKAIEYLRKIRSKDYSYDVYLNRYLRETGASKAEADAEASLLERGKETHPFIGWGILFIIISVLGFVLTIFSHGAGREVPTYLFGDIMNIQFISPYIIGYICLYASAILGLIFGIVLCGKEYAKEKGRKKKLFTTSFVICAITSVLIGISSLAYGAKHSVTARFYYEQGGENSRTYRMDDGLSYTSFPNAPEKAGHIFAGWKNQYGELMMEIKKGDYTNYKLTPYYVPNVKEFTFAAIGSKYSTANHAKLSFPELKNIMKYGYNAYFDISFQTLDASYVNLQASGGHTSKYSVSSQVNFRFGFASGKSTVLSLYTEIGANWFSGGSSQGKVNAGTTTIKDIKVTNLDKTNIDEDLDIDYNLGDKGDMYTSISKSKLKLTFRVEKK